MRKSKYSTITKFAVSVFALALLFGAAIEKPASAAPLIDPVTGLMIPDQFGTANWAYSPSLTKFLDRMPGLTEANANLLGQYIPVAVADQATFIGSDYYEIAIVEYQEQLHSELPATTTRGYVQLETPAVLTAMAAMNPPQVSKHVAVGGGRFGIDNPHMLGPTIVAQGGLKGAAGRPVRITFYNLLPADTSLFLPVDTTVMGAGMGPDGMTEYSQNRATIHLHGNNTAWISDGTAHQWITPAAETTPWDKGDSVAYVPDMWYHPTTHALVPAGTAGAVNDPGPGAMNFFYSNAQSARLLFYHDHSFGITRLNVYAGEAAGYVITDNVEQDMIQGTDVTGVNPGFLNVLPDIGIPLVIMDRTFVDPTTIAITDPTWVDPNQPTFGTNPGTAVAGDLWYPHVYVAAQNPYDLSGANPFGRWMYGPWFYPPTANLTVQGVVPNPYCLPTPPVDVAAANAGNYDCSAAPWEPPLTPGVPDPSMPGEAFMDTQTVNGTVFPYMDVEPKAYRFRILNASDDRTLNLSLYQATGIVGTITITNPGSGYTADPVVTITNGAGDTTGRGAQAIATADVDPLSPTYGQITSLVMTVVGSQYTANPVISIAAPGAGTQATATATFFTSLLVGGQGTEVGMVPVSGTDWLPPFDVSGVPDQAMAGPNWIQIGTEGGFLPAPVEIPAGPITWNTNPTSFNFGTVNGGSLILGTAERADVIVDFSQFAGQTLILYNDAPAAFPAPDPRLDYYTNDQDQQDGGGAPTTPPGKGPNTRTIMQIRVGTTVTTPTTDVTLANLQTVFAKTALKRGVFEASQEQIIIPQAAYNSAYNATYPTAASQQYIQINKETFTFQPINENGQLQAAVTLPMERKAAHDEMGGVYDTQYGRMSGMLGLEMPPSVVNTSHFAAYGYSSPPTDLIKASDVTANPVVTLGDGTQIWRIIHNGVDTHTIHTHLFNAQIINRVGWDGAMLPPDANELGFKDTYRMNPLEVLFIAMRPALPTAAQIPFLDQVPNSVRLIDPTMPEGEVLAEPPPMGWFDPFNGTQITTPILNHYVNYGWEYVWHCHILAHEEMDMMHSMVFAVPPKAPSGLSGGNLSNPRRVSLNWTDNSVTESGFTIQRARNSAFTQSLFTLGSVGANVTTYVDTTVGANVLYYYRVIANNRVGDTQIYNGIVNAGGATFETITADSTPSNTAVVFTSTAASVAAPSNLQLMRDNVPARITLTWTDNSNNETRFRIYQSVNGAAFTLLNTATRTGGQIASTGGTVTYVVNGVTTTSTYAYYIIAGSDTSLSPPSSTVSTASLPVPAVRLGAAAAYTPTRVNLAWVDNSTNETSFVVYRSVNGGAYSVLTTIARTGAQITSISGVSYTDSTVSIGTTYRYFVRAANASGQSIMTAILTVTP
jgi:FtsP/CotA-like multicopper oxidase with cupredoxin domain